MNELNLDNEIKAVEAQIISLQGKLELLRALRDAGAVVTLPAKPEGVQDGTGK